MREEIFLSVRSSMGIGGRGEHRGLQMVRGLRHPRADAPEYIGVLMHFAPPMCGLVPFVRADLQFDDRVDAHIGDHMGGIPMSQARHFSFSLPVGSVRTSSAPAKMACPVCV